jgi:hypothetical protein
MNCKDCLFDSCTYKFYIQKLRKSGLLDVKGEIQRPVKLAEPTEFDLELESRR